MHATVNFRFEEREVPVAAKAGGFVVFGGSAQMRTIRILQQLWVNDEQELYNNEWRDVPVVRKQNENS